MKSASGGGAGGGGGEGFQSSWEPGPWAAASAPPQAQPEDSSPAPLSPYESTKRRDWNTFLQYWKIHKPPLTLARCSGEHVIEFLKYLDQFGKTKVHIVGCPYFGYPTPPAPCACPFKQAWGSLDALIGRLRSANEENGGRPESNPFRARAVRIYLREVREGQAKARGIPYEKKKRKIPKSVPSASASVAGGVEVGGGSTTIGIGGDGSSGGVGGTDSVVVAAGSASGSSATANPAAATNGRCSKEIVYIKSRL